MINSEWVRHLTEFRETIAGKRYGIAYTASFFGNSQEIWYDRLSTDVPRFVSEALRKLSADSILLSVEEVTALCSSPEKVSRLSGIFNVCLGHRSLDNWTLVPAAAGWCGLPVFPNGAHATALGEDKLTALLYARACNLKTAEDWPEKEKWVHKPRGLGSSEGVRLSPDELENRQDWFSEPFIPGADVTATFLHNPASGEVECVGALLVSHQKTVGLESMWTKDKKTQGENKSSIKAKTLVQISPEASEACKEMAIKLGVRTGFRVDFRCPDPSEKGPIGLEHLYFLEINPTPTLSTEGSFGLTVRKSLEIHNRHTDRVLWPTSDFEAFAIASMIASVPNKTTARR